MRTTAAVVESVGLPWEIIDLELDDPRDGEVLIEFVAAGLCHSDESVRTGTLGGQARYPMVGGHEGAGIVRGVGRGVSGIAEGDHVVCAFRPSCGRCEYCSSGRSFICNESANTLRGSLPGDHFPFHRDGIDYGASCMLGTFSHYAVVSQSSCLVVPQDIPLQSLAVLGCAVPTGWGAAVYAAEVKPGDVVVVIGAGGVGLNACQGARIAGAVEIIVVDPVPSKVEAARIFGATGGFTDAGSATDYVLSLRQSGADAVILSAGAPGLAAAGMSMLRKGGNLTIAALGDPASFRLDLPIAPMVLKNQSIRGSVFGSANFRSDIPRLIDLYRCGELKLDELVSHRYALSDINQGFSDLLSGRNLRGIVVHE